MYDESDTRYNQIQQKNSHNSYDRKEGYDDQAIYWRIRGLEIDIHVRKKGSPSLDGDWYVYHADVPGGRASSVETLSDALDTMLAFAAAVPDHEVTTLFIDLKNPFDSTHTPEQLDALFTSKLGAALWGPPQLIAATGASSLQAAIAQGGWPVLSELRGKFVVVLTGGDLSSSTSLLNQYVDDGATANQRIGFVCPRISASSGISAADYAIFFSLSSSYVGLGPNVFDAGFVSRTWGLDSSGSWADAEGASIHHLATNEVNSDQDPWARTDNANGYPFQGNGISLDPSLTEPGSIYGIQVDSGDVWGTADSFFFAWNDLSGSPGQTLVSFVASPASHVEAWAKAGLMARASTAADAANFAVLRPAEKQLRVQYRTAAGAETQAVEVPIVPADTVSETTLIWIRLQVTDGGRTALGWGSLDGQSWTQIAAVQFSDPLVLQGWAASSHGAGPIRFLLGTTGGRPMAFASSQPIGDDAYGSLFPGIYPPPG